MDRRARIVATIGPASDSEEMLAALIQAGANVTRLNFSHGTQEWHAGLISRIRQLSGRLGKTVGILQDLQGPKIRTGTLVNHQPVLLRDGANFTITNRAVEGTAEVVSTTYADLPQDVRPGDTILLSDGAIELQVQAITSTDVQSVVVHGGTLKEHQGINLPGVMVSAPALTEKDKSDLIFGLDQGVDFIALSFVRQPSDVLTARKLIEEHIGSGAPGDPIAHDGLPGLVRPGGWHGPLLIAKLEKPQALDNLSGILEVVDGVMVARGDMGVEMSPQQVPTAQKMIIQAANERGRLVITATQMLESMITNPRPTRAEASDVANAIYDGTDAVMLSAETATGQYPIEAVRTMSQIVTEAERHLEEWGRWHPRRHPTLDDAESIARAGAVLAEDRGVVRIVAFTRTGRTALLFSKERPDIPIIALTPYDAVTCRSALMWGVQAICVPPQSTVEDMSRCVDNELLRAGLAKPGDTVLISGGLPVGSNMPTNFIYIHPIQQPAGSG